jgi:hypothetical protein
MSKNDGTLIDVTMVEGFKEELKTAFGGYTHLKQPNEGAWRMGRVTFREAITILRVLAEGSEEFDMQAFKARLETAFEQETILIIQRDVVVL